MVTNVETFKDGLMGVPAAKSRVSYADGQQGILEYRGIRIDDLIHRA